MKKLLLVLIPILLAVFIAGCTTGGTVETGITGRAVISGDTATVDYIGTFEDGTVFDASKESVAVENNIFNPQRAYDPLEFTVGIGQMIRGFEEAVVGMYVGETKKVTIQPNDAYGEVDERLIVTMNASLIRDGGRPLAIGGVVLTQTGQQGVITAVDEENVTIDFNHPFAGRVLNFEITLISIK